MLSRRHFFLLPLLVPAARAADGPGGATLVIAAASDLRFAFDELLKDFRAAQPGARIEVIYGSSGKLSTQIRHGAPFDIFFSADRAYAQALHEAGLTVGAPRSYALGRLALWSGDAALGRLSLDEVVRHPAVLRFAIANPEHAPYGQRAMEALRTRGLQQAVAAKLVLGDNVAQAAQFIASGAAQAGIVAHSLLHSPALAGKGAWTLLPQAWHSPLEQAYVLTRRAANPALATRFTQFLETPDALALLRRHGFELPTPPGAARP